MQRDGCTGTLGRPSRPFSPLELEPRITLQQVLAVVLDSRGDVSSAYPLRTHPFLRTCPRGNTGTSCTHELSRARLVSSHPARPPPSTVELLLLRAPGGEDRQAPHGSSNHDTSRYIWAIVGEHARLPCSSSIPTSQGRPERNSTQSSHTRSANRCLTLL